MKKLMFSLLLLFVVLNLNAQEPQMKIRLVDGNERLYLISDIEEMSFLKSNGFSYLKIIFANSTKANLDFKSIEKIEFSEKNDILSFYTCGYPYSYEIRSIDSIIFGYYYETVIIGNQIWLQYNLDVCHYRNGDPILHAQTDEEWKHAGEQGIGAWCYYNNNPENGKIYGKLYNWYAVNDPRGLSPAGWRVASDADFFGEGGHATGSWLAGEYELWEDGVMRNRIQFNISGFSGLPGGFRYQSGEFNGIRRDAYWWSSTEVSSKEAMERSINYGRSELGRARSIKGSGYSVRCMRD